MRSRVRVLIALLLSGPPALAAPLEGTWTGSYVCAQGETALDLMIKRTADGGLHAWFRFGDGSVGRPEGCFILRGATQGGQLTFRADRWLQRPPGYVMVDLIGAVTAATYQGLVEGPGCTTFALRWHALAAMPQACREFAAPVS